MNRVYRLVFNRARGVLQVVSELARAAGGGTGQSGDAERRVVAREGRLTAVAGAVLALLAAMPMGARSAAALPTGALIVDGSGATDFSVPDTLTVNQTSSVMGATWGTWNVGSAGRVNFVQPGSSSVAINRVTGGISDIRGMLTANGQVFLSNLNAILLGSTASVNASGVLLTSLGISNSGNPSTYQLDARAGQYALVMNEGTVTASSGAVSLTGARVVNAGTVSANGGRIELTAADHATVTVDASGQTHTTIASGGALTASLGTPAVSNTGVLLADNGTIVLQAAAAPGMFGPLVGNTGVLMAAGTGGGDGGRVTLSAVGGDLQAGGTIDVRGARGGQVTLSSDATVTVSGTINAAGYLPGGGVSVSGGAIRLGAGHQIDARLGSLSLVSNSTITQDAGGTLKVGSLAGRSTGATHLDGANKISTIDGFSASSFRLVNGQDLSIRGLDGGASVDVTMTAGNLVFAGDVRGTTTTLQAAGSIGQVAGGITAQTLTGHAVGNAQFGLTNYIDTLGPFTANNFRLTNGQTLNVAGAIDGGPGVYLETQAGDLVLGANVTGEATTLASKRSILQTGGVLTANTLYGMVSGDTTLDNMNQVSELTGFVGLGALSLTNGQALKISGHVSASKLSLDVANGVVVTGSVQTTSPVNGGTFMRRGTLQIGDGGTTGAIDGDIHLDTELTFKRSNDLRYTGKISGSTSLIQAGSGTLTLAGDSTYTGVTEVNAGTLRVSNTTGSATGTSTVQVKNGATLSGGGTIAGQVTIADGATLAPGVNMGTLTTGMLRFDPGAFLRYELGQAGTVGGPLNDLVKVNGGLVLDGTLNVAQSAGGTFGPGLYRLISYTGSLIDNGLNIGSMPTGTAAGDLYVQSSVFGEINLINSKGVVLGYWDGSGGDAIQYNDGKIGGGSGTWRVGNSKLNDPSDSWTDANGKANAGWQQNQFALFGGAAGTVRVDNSGGAISIDGAQFSTGGYVVTGDALTLGNANTVIKVGDGSASGAQMQATIASVLTGAGGLTKDDLGTLILKGANTYTGGTLVSAGTLQGDTTSLRGAIVNNAQVAFDQVASGSFAGTMSGTGRLRKIGSGELALAAANTYKGGTQVDGGSLNVGVTGAVGTGPVGVNSGAALIFSGSADAESLKITAGATQPGNGGFVQFQDNASAGHATLVAQAGGSIDFRGNATAGNATIENRGGEVMVWFNANAGKAHITNFAGGATNIWGDASAGQATIVNERDGVLDIRDNATAAQASVVNKAGGTVFLSKLGTPGITIGSLEGAGRVLLGAKALTTGALNTDTEISGVISGVGGSLVKVGTGTLTLSGENTHTGGTALRQGRLNVGHSQALGTGTLSMDDDTTLGFSANGLTIANPIQLTGNNDPLIDTGAFNGALSG
ncbi:MAG: autotransporter-associated beta strand repeat-containing protein, partial [Variovorax sp.]|nr:autotransporter-associated beta strand repeat-containing protein [Variovorax sp.]